MNIEAINWPKNNAANKVETPKTGADDKLIKTTNAPINPPPRITHQEAFIEILIGCLDSTIIINNEENEINVDVTAAKKGFPKFLAKLALIAAWKGINPPPIRANKIKIDDFILLSYTDLITCSSFFMAKTN